MIVQKQRDRFRQNVQDLEAVSSNSFVVKFFYLSSISYQQMLHKQQSLQHLEAELSQSRQDNIAMYEKVKFLQSRSGPSSGSQQGRDVENRYSTAYNERLDPFNRFRMAERATSYQALAPHEKITLGFVSFTFKCLKVTRKKHMFCRLV